MKLARFSSNNFEKNEQEKNCFVFSCYDLHFMLHPVYSIIANSQFYKDTKKDFINSFENIIKKLFSQIQQIEKIKQNFRSLK